MLRKIAANFLLAALSLALFLGGMEWGIGTFYGHRIRTYFEDQTVAALGDPVPPKAPDEYRIFVFGGSYAYGFPMADRYSITAWLRKDFPYLLPQKKVKIINTAWPGKGSHHVLEGALNVLKYEPDLFVIYSGHNDVPVASRLYVDNWLYWVSHRLRFRSAAYRWLSSRLNRLRKHIVYGSSGYPEKQYREEVIGYKIYHRLEVTAKEYDLILKRYEQNMEELIRAAKKKGVDILFTNLPSNIRDIPPPYSFHQPLTDEKLKEWNQYFGEGVASAGNGDHSMALKAYLSAAAIDPTYAELQYKMGISYEALGQYPEAKQAFILAKDYDGMASRAKTSLNDLIQRITEKHGLIFTDLIATLEAQDPHGIIGKEIIYDSVHPSELTQLMIAEAILKRLWEEEKIAPKSEWQWGALQAAKSEKSGEWAIDPSVESHHMILRGIEFWQQGRYAQVVDDLEKGIKLKPDFLELYGFLGDTYWHLGQQEKARRAFETFYKKDPKAFESTLERYPDLKHSYSQSSQTLAAR